MSRLNLIRLVGLASMWGASFLFIKIGLQGLTPIQLVLARLVTGSVVLLVILAVLRQPPPASRRVWLHLTVMAMIGNITPFFLISWGEERVSSGLAGVLNGTAPLFTLGIAVVALSEERLSARRVGAFLLGFLGVVLVLRPWEADLLASSVTGQLACLAAAACYGMGFVYSRRYLAHTGYPALALSATQISIAAVLLLALSPLVARTPVHLTPAVVASVLALGALGTGVSYLLFYRLIAEAGATSTSLVAYLLPVVAVTLGVAVLGEAVRWNVLVGAAMVIAGVGLAEGRVLPRRKEEPVESPTVDAPLPPREGEDEAR